MFFYKKEPKKILITLIMQAKAFCTEIITYLYMRLSTNIKQLKYYCYSLYVTIFIFSGSILSNSA